MYVCDHDRVHAVNLEQHNPIDALMFSHSPRILSNSSSFHHFSSFLCLLQYCRLLWKTEIMWSAQHMVALLCLALAGYTFMIF